MNEKLIFLGCLFNTGTTSFTPVMLFHLDPDIIFYTNYVSDPFTFHENNGRTGVAQYIYYDEKNKTGIEEYNNGIKRWEPIIVN